MEYKSLRFVVRVCIKILCFSLLLLSYCYGEKLTVILDWFPNPDHAPLFTAQEFGFFKDQNLDVKLIGPADPSDPPKLVAAGKADIAVTYEPQLIMQVAQGLPLKAVGTLIATPLNCLITKNTIHSIKDLKGKTIGYSTAGVDQVMLKTMLNNQGLTLNDVNLINVHYNLTQALLSGRIDGATGMMRNFELTQIQMQNVPVTVFYPEENGVPPYNELIYIAQKNEANKPAIKKFLEALTLATQYLLNHPQACWEKFAKEHPDLNNDLNKKVWFQTLSRFALRPAAFDEGRWQNFIDFLYDKKLITHKPALKNIIN